MRRQARDTVGLDSCADADWIVYRLGRGWRRASCFAWIPTGPSRGWLEDFPQSQDARGVALKVNYFDEGAQRLVREFRDIGSYGKFLDQPLVAKESLFQADVTNLNLQQLIDLHRAFCDAQVRASRLAAVFDVKLSQLPEFDPQSSPTVTSLHCAVYVVDDDINLGTVGCLVEKQLDPVKYKKWSDNKGMVNGQAAQQAATMEPLGTGSALVTLIEEGEDGESDEEAEESVGEIVYVMMIFHRRSHTSYTLHLQIYQAQGALLRPAGRSAEAAAS